MWGARAKGVMKRGGDGGGGCAGRSGSLAHDPKSIAMPFPGKAASNALCNDLREKVMARFEPKFTKTAMERALARVARGKHSEILRMSDAAVARYTGCTVVAPLHRTTQSHASRDGSASRRT